MTIILHGCSVRFMFAKNTSFSLKDKVRFLRQEQQA